MKKHIILIFLGIFFIFLGFYLKEDNEIIKNYKINDVMIIDHYFEFKKDKKEYTIYIRSNEKTLDFDIDTNYKYEIVGNANIKEDDIIYLNLYKDKKLIDTYSFLIKKDFKIDFYGYNIENVTSSNNQDAIKKMKVNEKDVNLKFSHNSLNEDNCPNEYLISVEGVTFFNEEMPCTLFYDFNVLNDLIIFAYKNINGISVIAIKNDGYVVFKLNDINGYYISEYSKGDTIKVVDNGIKILSTIMDGNSVNVDGELTPICDVLSDTDIFYEYSFNYLNSSFSGAYLSDTIKQKDLVSKYNCK